MDRNLTDLFNKFVGREFDSRFDPVLDDIEDVARQNGLALRVFFPGTGSNDFSSRPDRVNVEITQGSYSQFRIARFDVG